MASKKRKVDFSADAILSEISQAREFAQNVQKFRESLSLVKIKEMLGTVQTVNFDVAGLVLESKLMSPNKDEKQLCIAAFVRVL